MGKVSILGMPFDFCTAYLDCSIRVFCVCIYRLVQCGKGHILTKHGLCSVFLGCISQKLSWFKEHECDGHRSRLLHLDSTASNNI